MLFYISRKKQVILGASAYDSHVPLDTDVPDMYSDEYFPDFLADKIKAIIKEVVL